MKPFDTTLLISGCGSLLAALISIINAVTTSKNSKKEKIKNVILTLLAICVVWGLLFLFAYFFKAESDILNLHPNNNISTDNSESMFDSSAETQLYSISTNSTECDTLSNWTLEFSTEATLPTESFEYISPSPNPGNYDISENDLPYAWLHNESSWYVLYYFAEHFDEEVFNPIVYDNHLCYLTSKSDVDAQVYNKIIVDELSYCDASSCDGKAPPYPHSLYYSDYSSYRAIYFRFHYLESFDSSTERGISCSWFDSSGQHIDVGEYYADNSFESDSGYVVLLIPPEINNDKYLLVFTESTLSGNDDPSVFMTVYFMLDIG